MGDFLHGRNKKKNSKDQEEPDVSPSMLANAPTFWKVLGGFEEEPGVFVQGMAMTFWYVDGRIKFSINDKSTGMVGYGTLQDNRDFLSAVELALKGGEIDWKESRSQDRRR